MSAQHQATFQDDLAAPYWN